MIYQIVTIGKASFQHDDFVDDGCGARNEYLNRASGKAFLMGPSPITRYQTL